MSVQPPLSCNSSTKRPVNFYLGHSKKSVHHSMQFEDHSCSSTDIESDFDDKYCHVDADEYSRFSNTSCSSSYTSLSRFTSHPQQSMAIDINSRVGSSSSNKDPIYSSNDMMASATPRNNISLVTPPSESGKFGVAFFNNTKSEPQQCLSTSQSSIKSILDRATTVNEHGEVTYSCQSIAYLTKAISDRSLPPSPPRSFCFSPQPTPSLDFTSSTSTIVEPERASSATYPSSILSSLRKSFHDELKMKPQSPSEHKLIPINLEPVSPMFLAQSVDDDADIDEYDLDYGLTYRRNSTGSTNSCAIYDDEDNTSFHRFDEGFQRQVSDDDIETTISPEFLVGYEQEIISQLNLEEHSVIVDKFRARPLLADGNRPYIPCSPIFETVEELLAERYPYLQRGSQEFSYHLRRLQRNRQKLKDLSQCIDRYDQARRKRLSESHTREEKRFRARRWWRFISVYHCVVPRPTMLFFILHTK